MATKANVRIDDDGQAKVYGFVERDDAQAFFNTTIEAFPRQYLCERIAGPAG